VKASVMDVALNDAFNLQVNAASISGSDGFASRTPRCCR
jgi:hypothetical protein